MRKKKLAVVALVMALVGITLFAACRKENNIAFEQDYELILPYVEDEGTVVLTHFSTPIARIACKANWLALASEMRDGHPVLRVRSLSPAEQVREAEVEVWSESDEVAHVRVMQGGHLLGGALDEANIDFINDWENCATVLINGEENPVATPWESDNQCNIPYEIRKQCKKADGWEMAFCSLNNTATNKICFFALYNKWTGTLRVFHYIKDPRGYGNEITYRVWMGRETSSNNTPYYHALEYGVPANHTMNTSLNGHSNFVGTPEQTQSFMAWVTPYLLFTNSLVSGWYCFDLDMSGYMPNGTQWRDVEDDVKMIIVPQISSRQDITLRGTLVGDIGGSFENPQVIQHGGGNCMSGICGILDQLSGRASSSISSGVAYANAMKNATGIDQYLTPAKYWGGYAASIASGLLGFIGNQMAEPATYENIPGKIDMKLDAQLDLAGTISSYTSTDQAIYNVTLANINSSNGANGHMGRGVWSLESDPVVYIDKDDLISDYDHFTLLSTGTGYRASDIADYNVRMMWFFDPTSVKVNLNRNLFPNVDSVKVTTSCGIYTGRKTGNTDPFRRFLMLPDRPTFPLHTDTSSNIVRLGANTTPAVHVATCENLLVTGNTEFETAENSTLVQQAGGNYRFYGYEADANNKKVMVDPQVFLAYNGSDIEMPKAPDFVVTVNVVFESGGSTYLYSKCFVPKVEIIDRATTLQKRAALQQYSAKSKAGQPTGTLANSSEPVYSPDGDRLIARTLLRLGLIN